jgi:hypothetical protein
MGFKLNALQQKKRKNGLFTNMHMHALFSFKISHFFVGFKNNFILKHAISA